MKTSRILLIGLFAFAMIKNSSASAQSMKYMDPGYYVIVGAFGLEEGAASYTQDLMKSGKKNARYAFYPPKGLYYVHLGKHLDSKRPTADLKELRNESGFDKAWVFKATPYDRPDEGEQKIVAEEIVEEEPEKIQEVQEIIEEDDAIEEVDNTEISGVLDLTGDAEGEDYFLYLNVTRLNDGREVNGNVEIIDPDKLRRVKLAEAHASEFIPKSFSRSGNVEMICEIFGYKKVQHDFNIAKPFNEMTEPFLSYIDSRLVVDFQLERLSKGDLVTMYNVYFYKDAAIMRAESKYELNQLLEMLQENPNYQIMIYGHTNGNNSGPIITLQDDSKGYFSKSAPTNEKKGSAKKLSQERASIIKKYLVNQGIDESRMTAKGHGGKKSIYKKLDPLAYKNVRVEIEIIVD